MHSQSLLESQRKIDEEIRNLENRPHALRESRNTFSFVNQLPAEVITEIFSPIFASSGGLSALVARLFGLVPLSDQKADFAYAQHALRLSLPLPVTFTDALGYAHGIDPKFLESYIPSLHRARKIVATSHTATFLAELLQKAPSQAPNLQNVEFSRLTQTNGESPFPQSLSRLTLSASYFKWDWLKLGQLVELHLSHNNVPRVTVVSFLDLMSHIPNLSHLDVRRVFTRPPSDHNHETRPTTPALGHLTIADAGFLVNEFISSITFKEKFTLRISSSSHNRAETCQTLFPHLNQHLRASRRVIRAGVLARKNSWDRSIKFSCIDHTTSPFLSVDIYNFEDISSMMEGFATLPLGALQRFSTDLFQDKIHWKACSMTPLNSLHELVIGNRASSHAFLNYLAEQTESAKKSKGTVSFSFPALQKITLGDFRDRPDTRKKLTGTFKERAKHGLRVPELTFKDSKIMGVGLKHFRDVFVHLTLEESRPYDWQREEDDVW